MRRRWYRRGGKAFFDAVESKSVDPTKHGGWMIGLWALGISNHIGAVERSNKQFRRILLDQATILLGKAQYRQLSLTNLVAVMKESVVPLLSKKVTSEPMEEPSKFSENDRVNADRLSQDIHFLCLRRTTRCFASNNVVCIPPRRPSQ